MYIHIFISVFLGLFGLTRRNGPFNVALQEAIRKRARFGKAHLVSSAMDAPKEVIFVFLTFFSSFIKSEFETIFQTATLEYEEYENHQYIANNNNLGVVRTFQDKIYVSVPRWRNGVPFTLNTLQDTKLRAFPDTASNKIDDCEALQNVVAIGNVQLYFNSKTILTNLNCHQAVIN